jgi:hypothetical protein
VSWRKPVFPDMPVGPAFKQAWSQKSVPEVVSRVTIFSTFGKPTDRHNEIFQ